MNSVLKRNFFSICFDNASENTATTEYLEKHTRSIRDEKLFYVHCVCYIIDLFVQDGLKIDGDFVVKFRNIIMFIKYSRPIRKAIESICQGLHLRPRLLPQNIRT